MESRQTANDIESEAARWVLRLDREGRTASSEAELKAWLAVDTRRQGAFLQAEAAWTMLDRGQFLTNDHAPAPARRPLVGIPRRALFAAAGAAIAASVVAGVLITAPVRYDTALGEVRRVPLADGSTVALNTESAVEANLDGNLRRVRLTQGEAWFQVAKDPSRPFIVEAGLARAQAIGTAFSVRRKAGGTEVMVTEGVVKVWMDGAEAEAVELLAGSRAFLADSAGISSRLEQASEIDRELAWRSGRIDLAGESLGDAVGEFNRYNSRKLIVSSDLADERLYGVFRLDDPEGFARAVGASLDTRVTAGSSEIVLGQP